MLTKSGKEAPSDADFVEDTDITVIIDSLEDGEFLTEENSVEDVDTLEVTEVDADAMDQPTTLFPQTGVTETPIEVVEAEVIEAPIEVVEAIVMEVDMPSSEDADLEESESMESLPAESVETAAATEPVDSVKILSEEDPNVTAPPIEELPAESKPWAIEGVGLNDLMAAMKGSILDKDEWTPIVTDLSGGDRIAIYFNWSRSSLTARGNLQLKILADVLNEQPETEILITALTDQKGNPKVNRELGLERGRAVEGRLKELGVAEEQIASVDYSPTQPPSEVRRQKGVPAPSADSAGRCVEIELIN